MTPASFGDLRRKRVTMTKLAFVALLASLALSAPAVAQTWEYKVEEVDLIAKVRVFANDLLLSGDDLEGVLTPLGADGWELVGSVSRGGTSLLLVFKRPVAAALPPIQTRPGESPAPSPEKGGAPSPPEIPPADGDGPAPTESGATP
jgi:hypothetical protein